MGLLLSNFVDNIGEALSRKKAFKPGVHFAADPVPALTGDKMMNIPAFKPGHGAPDPVPSIPADASSTKAFKTPVTLNPDGSMSWMEVSPVPTKSGEA